MTQAVAALVVLAGCRLGIAPGLTHRLDRGTDSDENAVVGGVQGELGAVLPYHYLNLFQLGLAFGVAH